MAHTVPNPQFNAGFVPGDKKGKGRKMARKSRKGGRY